MHDPLSVTHSGTKSSPHRPFLSMQTSSRLYHCCRCHAQVIVCRRCDRGQRYCTGSCSQEARVASLKRAGKKYQASRAGRFSNAKRQQRFRYRKKQKVTHHCSLQILCHDVLKNKPNWPDEPKMHRQISTTVCCHHCGSVCEPFLRSDFLHSSRFTQVFRRH